MNYTVTLKGFVSSWGFDSILNKYFSDPIRGYSKIEIEAPNEKVLFSELDKMTQGRDLKIIGVHWPDCPGNHEDDEQICKECLNK
ncbi:MAG: hypothetical protein V4549_06465 [Bacteroidota bacterium]